jgi:hypothetical protein
LITLAICTEPSDFVKEKHICYFTTNGLEENTIRLEEVVERFYKHPQAPEDAIIPVIETRVIKVCNRNSMEAAVLLLMEANQKAIMYQA